MRLKKIKIMNVKCRKTCKEISIYFGNILGTDALDNWELTFNAEFLIEHSHTTRRGN